MSEFINYVIALESEFNENINPENAAKQKAYMRNKFEFLGIKSGLRNEILKPYFRKENLPQKEQLELIVKQLWQKPERDYQYFAQELTQKYSRKLEKKDILLFEHMITHKSWWDTVDFISSNLVGTYFKIYPEEINGRVEKWLNSGNIWLQRTALLFQLKYRGEKDTKIMTRSIEYLLGSNEFFINKAIGWILREYGKFNPEWVLQFVKTHELNPLSKREALRIIISRN